MENGPCNPETRRMDDCEARCWTERARQEEVWSNSDDTEKICRPGNYQQDLTTGRRVSNQDLTTGWIVTKRRSVIKAFRGSLCSPWELKDWSLNVWGFVSPNRLYKRIKWVDLIAHEDSHKMHSPEWLLLRK